VPVYERLDALSITLPELTPPVAAFVPFLRSGNLLFLAGHIAKMNGKPWVGQLGANLTTAQGKEAARAVAIDLMGALHAAVGDLPNQAHREADGAREQHSSIHRTTSGGQWGFGAFRRGLWRYREARSQRLRGCSSAVWIVCGNRACG
jgi:hypothetical protein